MCVCHLYAHTYKHTDTQRLRRPHSAPVRQRDAHIVEQDIKPLTNQEIQEKNIYNFFEPSPLSRDSNKAGNANSADGGDRDGDGDRDRDGDDDDSSSSTTKVDGYQKGIRLLSSEPGKSAVGISLMLVLFFSLSP